MKKIYILTAVFALLTLSLNAQLRTTNKVGITRKAPAEKVATAADGKLGTGPSRISYEAVTPPYTNDFSTTALQNWWEVISDGYGNTWTFSNQRADYPTSRYYDADDWLVTAPITLEAGKAYEFSIDAWVDNSYYAQPIEVKMASDHTVNALDYGKAIIRYSYVDWSSAQTLSKGNINVSENGNYYFGIHVTSEAMRNHHLYVDNFSIKEVTPVHDLAVTLSAPDWAGAGCAVPVVATVTNMGNIAEQGYTVTITANGEPISTQTGNRPLLSEDWATFTAQYPTDASAAGQTVNFAVTVTCNNDADGSNNNATASAPLIALPLPENVAATAGDQSGTMTWDAPTISPTTVTEGFEYTYDFPAFSIGGITASTHFGSFGAWTIYDSTGAQVWGSTEEDFPNESLPHAWMVFNAPAVDADITAHGGDQYMESICPLGSSGYTSDHWLISPELSGNRQTITFWERVITGQYGNETYEVLASSDGNNPSDFSVVQSFSSAQTTWTQRSVTLPAGTKYFAIRHTSNDIFGMMIDDVTYETFVPRKPASYNVYLDGELVENVNSDVLTYTFNNVSEGEHQCAVSAVYPCGAETASVGTTFTVMPLTDAPTIAISSTTATDVTITATGNGTVVLNIPGYPEATGTGSASITVPRRMEDYVVSASATAQETGHAVSTTTTESFTIPGFLGEGWLLMDGTYNGDEQLRFTYNGDPILFIDQFAAETNSNQHANKYVYQIKDETINKSSGKVTIPVHKTWSTMQGLYTQKQVNDDKDYTNALPANVINSKVSFDIQHVDEMYYYSLNRSSVNNSYPLNNQAISKLQESNEKFSEQLTLNVLPKYQNVNSGVVSRLDNEFVVCEFGDEMNYVPVIWTMGFKTNRRDNLNNSYGSDIKNEKLGSVSAEIEGQKSDYSEFGMFKVKVNGVDVKYCVYTPVITITGTPPVEHEQGDGDVSTYEPYLFRAWCLYEGARDFDHDADGHLIDAGPMDVPFLLGEFWVNPERPDDIPIIGGDWEYGMGRLPWAFGVPVTGVDPSTIPFAVRFYYKKNVSDAQSGSKLNPNRDGEEENEYYIAECKGDASKIITAINEFYSGRGVIGVTYVNPQGMQSDHPFDGVNIVVTRYSDGTTSTTKVIR